MKIKNYQIKYIIELLSSLKFKGKQARKCGQFIRILTEYYYTYVVEGLKQLQHDYAVKDENDKIIYLDEEKTKFHIDQDYIVQEQILLNEEYIFELNEFNKMLLLCIAEILLEGDFEVNGEIASYYDEWCEQAEKVIEYYTSKEEA